MKKTKHDKNLLSSKSTIIIVAIVPSIVFFTMFSYGPTIYAFFLSFTRYILGKPVKFIGFGNYVEILKKESLFYKSLGNTFYYAIVTIPVGMILALVVAVVINSLGAIGKIFRAIYFIPVVVSIVAIAVVWRWLYQPLFGPINLSIKALGGPRLMWLNSPFLAMPAVMIMSLWHRVGYTMIIFLAGLQGIPQILYEAAIVDGANRWQMFRKITIPLLMPVVTFILVIGTIDALQVFTEMYVLLGAGTHSLGSGPLGSTRTVVVHLYECAFTYFEMGYASAIALLLFIIILAFTIVQLHLLQTKWEY